jgi:hypothetical protein
MALAQLFPLAARREPDTTAAWLALLVAAALLSSVTFACVTPFAAFSVLTAATMKLPRALAATVAIWLVNQALGYLALGYPVDGASLAWGGGIGIAALAATVAAAAIVRVVRVPFWPRLAAGLVAAIVAYEGLLLVVSLGLGGTENFAPDIVAKVALSDACWFVAIAILRHWVSRFEAIRRSGRHPVTT